MLVRHSAGKLSALITRSSSLHIQNTAFPPTTATSPNPRPKPDPTRNTTHAIFAHQGGKTSAADSVASGKRKKPRRQSSMSKPTAKSLSLRRKLPIGAPQPFDGRVGVGVSFSSDLQGNHVIQHLLEGGSAQECGEINVGDIIFAVNGETVTGMPVSEVVYKIKGEPGTNVSIVFIKKTPPSMPFPTTPQPPVGGRPMSMASPGASPVMPEPRSSMGAGSPLYPSQREKILDEQLDTIKKVQAEQEQRERMLAMQQSMLMKSQSEVDAQKEQLRILQAQQIAAAASPPRFVPHAMADAVEERVQTKQWDDGKTYKGEFLNGKRHGRGRISYPDGSQYDGEWSNDLRHGQGLYRYADGTQYHGSWVDGNRNGLGMCQYSDGNKYEGEWLNNLPHGAGSCRFGEGSVYKGEFVEGRMHGFGTLYAPDGTPSFQGQWHRGEKVRLVAPVAPQQQQQQQEQQQQQQQQERYVSPQRNFLSKSQSSSPGGGAMPEAEAGRQEMEWRVQQHQQHHQPQQQHHQHQQQHHQPQQQHHQHQHQHQQEGGADVPIGNLPHVDGGERREGRDGDFVKEEVRRGSWSGEGAGSGPGTGGLRCGVGLKLSQERRGTPIVIEKIQKGSASDVDGRLQPGDIITRVDGISVSDAANAGVLIQGSPGTAVSIVAERRLGAGQPPRQIQVALTRRNLSIKRGPGAQAGASNAGSGTPARGGSRPASHGRAAGGGAAAGPNDCPTM